MAFEAGLKAVVNSRKLGRLTSLLSAAAHGRHGDLEPAQPVDHPRAGLFACGPHSGSLQGWCEDPGRDGSREMETPFSFSLAADMPAARGEARTSSCVDILELLMVGGGLVGRAEAASLE